MYRPFLWATIAVAAVCASGEFIVLHSPESVEFTESEGIDQSTLTEVFAAALGYTRKQKVNWSGILIKDILALPEAVVVIAIEGVESLNSLSGIKYPMNVDEEEETTWQALSGRLEERGKNNTLVRLCPGDGLNALGQSALGELKPEATNETFLESPSSEDQKFVDEIQLLRAIAKKVSSTKTVDGKQDVYWLVVSGLWPVINGHNKDPAPGNKALKLLNKALSDISEDFKKVYNNKVIIAAFTNGISKSRQTRAAGDDTDKKTTKEKDDSDKNDKTTERPPVTTVGDSIKSDDDEESEKIMKEETKTGDIGEGSNLKVANASSSNDENDETKSRESASTEAHESRNITSTERSSTELDGTTLSYDHSNTDTENTNRPLKIADLKLGLRYNDNYPAIFNIFLWFGVIFVFSLLAICITIGDMDPGRDSIIYRMTSNRMKKDN